jgi:MerR family transcriptional regulator, light-induced transcriptional regulator
MGEIASRTGVTEQTLRMWERRHDFPRPERGAGGHRRYTEEQLEQVQGVVAARSRGLSLSAAIEQVLRLQTPANLSLFATIRRRRPELQPQLVGKPAMIALSHAIEDESLARAENQLLFGCFQRERFFRQEQDRWRELSNTAVTAVFAEFAAPMDDPGGPLEIPIATPSSLSREWSIVGYGPRTAICLAGREPASSSTAAASAARSFEMVWTVDAPLVRELAGACVRLAATIVPQIEERASELLTLEPVVGSEEQLRLATAVINRTLAQLADPGVGLMRTQRS